MAKGNWHSIPPRPKSPYDGLFFASAMMGLLSLCGIAWWMRSRIDDQMAVEVPIIDPIVVAVVGDAPTPDADDDDNEDPPVHTEDEHFNEEEHVPVNNQQVDSNKIIDILNEMAIQIDGDRASFSRKLDRLEAKINRDVLKVAVMEDQVASLRERVDGIIGSVEEICNKVDTVDSKVGYLESVIRVPDYTSRE